MYCWENGADNTCTNFMFNDDKIISCLFYLCMHSKIYVQL